MGKKSGPAPPPAPDPYATAAAQAGMNKETAIANAYLNRINQTSPWGSVSYAVTGTNPDGTPQFSQTTSLSPTEQRQYDQQSAIAEQLGGFAQNSLGRVEDVMSKPFSFTGVPDLQYGVNTGGLPTFGRRPNVPGLATSIGPTGDISRNLNLANLPSMYNGNVQGKLDYSNLPNIPGVGDFSADRQKVEDALYNRATSRLNPRFQQDQADLENRLVNMGIPRGSEAWNREMDSFSRNKNDAYSSAMQDAIAAGGSEQSRIFGLGLGARQQMAQEGLTTGQFANAADQQRYNYATGNRDQAFQEAQAAGNFQNQAQQQEFGQQQARASFGNDASSTMYDQGMAGASLDNAQRMQAYNELANNVQLNNTGRQQSMQEQAFLRELPINEIATMLGVGGQVQQPTFNPVPSTTMDAANLEGDVYNSYNGQMNAWQLRQQQRQSALGGIFGLMGSLGGAAIMSDRRIKYNIKRITNTAKGIPLYVFSYIGEKARQFGTMAQDVMHIPGAVVDSGGVLMVDYRKVWA